VNPDGQPASYVFELGIYAGAATQYGVVFSGSTTAVVGAVPESLGLTGLQPGTAYAYRVKISSGYGTSYGEQATFTTLGLPTVLVSPVAPALLTVPRIVFPVESKPPTPTGQCKRGFKRDKHGKCIRSRKTTKAHRHKSTKSKK
jgi:hypothetical protein